MTEKNTTPTVAAVLNEDYAFMRQGYQLIRDVRVKDRVVRLNVYLDGAYAGQSRIEASLFDGDRFNSIVVMPGKTVAVEPLIASYVSPEDQKKASLEAVAHLLIDRVLRII